MFQPLINILEVAKCGSINKAAERLFVSQQALRMSITSTEKELGFKIFNRTNKGVSLTENGERLIRDIQKLLEITQKWDSYRENSTGLEGMTHIITTSLGSQLILHDVILNTRKEYPNLSIFSLMCRMEDLPDVISKKRMIGLLISVEVPQIKSRIASIALANDYEYEIIWNDSIEIFLNKNNPLAKQQSITLSQLQDLTLVMYPEENVLSSYKEIYDSFSHEQPIIDILDFNIFNYISHNKNAGTVYPRIAEKMRYSFGKTITHLPIKDFDASDACIILYPKWNTLSSAEKKLIEQLRLHLNEFGIENNVLMNK